MNKIFKIIFLQIFLLLISYLCYYIYNSELISNIYLVLELFIPISATALILFLLLNKINNKDRILLFFYIIFLILIDFSLREFLLPTLDSSYSHSSLLINNPQKNINKIFKDITKLPFKKGIIFQNPTNSYSFGIVALQNPHSYLLKNILYSSSDTKKYSLYAQYGQISNNKLILYNSKLFIEKNGKLIPSERPQKNYEIPLSFDIDTLFNLWNIQDTNKLQLIPILFNNYYFKDFPITILIVLSRYITGFLFLLIIYILGLSCQNYISFKGLQIIGNLCLIICIFPIVLSIYYYILILLQTLIYLI